MAKKKDNQYFGELHERTIVELYNGEKIDFDIEYDFTKEEIEKVTNNAQKVVDFIKEDIHPKRLEWIGRSTGSELGDIKADDVRIELKYVAGDGSGTYHNTSISFFEKMFGLPNYINFLKEHGYFDWLRENIPIKCEESGMIFDKESRHKLTKEQRKMISDYESKIRIEYVNLLYDYFNENNDELRRLFELLIKKQKSTGKQKGIVDYLIAQNSITGELTVITKNDFKEFKLSEFSKTDKSLILGDLALVIGWQNGNGLCNPTLRVFLRNGKERE